MTKPVSIHLRKGLAIQAVLFVLMSAAGLYGFIHSGFFALTHIEVLGAEQLEPSEVRKLAALPLGSNLWRIDEIQVIKNVKAHPKIGWVQVARQLPGTLIISIQERKAACFIPTDRGFVELDSTGVALRILDQVSGNRLPLITGSTVKQHPLPGERVVAANLELGLKMLSSMPQILRQSTAELDVSNKESISLYTTEGTRVIMGAPQLLQEKYQALVDVLSLKDQVGPRNPVDYIDLTHPERPAVKYAK
ncbi:MAG: cell division protein FtsQ/DivIB [Bacillota bacterium]